jgi:hypothetical protein
MVVTGVNMLLVRRATAVWCGTAPAGRGSRAARAPLPRRSCSRPRTVAAIWTTTSC